MTAVRVVPSTPKRGAGARVRPLFTVLWTAVGLAVALLAASPVAAHPRGSPSG